MSNQVDLSSLTNLENLVASLSKINEQDVKKKVENDQENCQNVSLGCNNEVERERLETQLPHHLQNVPNQFPIDNKDSLQLDHFGFDNDLPGFSIPVFKPPECAPNSIKHEFIVPPKKSQEVIDLSLDSDDSSRETSPVKNEENAASFAINMASIPTVPKENQNDELWNLGITVYDQTELEEGVMAQVESSFQKQERERKKKHVEKDLAELESEIKSVRIRLCQIDKALAMAPKEMNKEAKRKVESIKREKENKVKQLKRLEVRKKSLFTSIGQQLDPDDPDEANIPQNYELDNETKFQLQKVFQDSSESLIRSGEMTPFGTVMSNVPKKAPALKTNSNELTDFEKFLLNQSSQKVKTTPQKLNKPRPSPSKPSDIKNKDKFVKKKTKTSSSTLYQSQPSTSKVYPPLTVVKSTIKCKSPEKVRLGSQFATGTPIRAKRKHDKNLNINYKSDAELSDFENGDANYDETGKASDDEYVPELVSDESGNESSSPTKKRKKCDLSDEDEEDWVSVKKNKNSESNKMKNSSKHRVIDDGNEKSYLKRMKTYNAQKKLERHNRSEQGLDPDEEPCVEFDGGLKVPTEIWDKLFRYQQTGVRWLWELHQQNCGGIVGDEMGLGKTIQVIAFFAALKVSEIETIGDKFKGLGPSILVCPATVMHQWVKEFHKWCPPIRVAVLHESGSYHGRKSTLIRYITNTCGVLITSYQGLTRFQNDLLAFDWHYIVLDEGHKIRNPDAQVTLACKQFRTPHRIILSGSPMQNNLKELWSLFDFVFPGKLGTLPTFMQEFSVPITQGGYSNASEVQVQTAYKCAVVLRNTIKPYLLRRLKSDVQMSLQLPDKHEQVLFCKLTNEQREMYKSYLATPEISQIVDGKFQIFVGLIALRKICNHPDIFDGGPKIFRHTEVSLLREEEKYGYYKRSGKMVVVDSLLRLWKQQGHRVLLFTQSRQMLKIFQIFMEKRGYKYMAMDGTVNIAARQPAINKFNSDESVFIFLLTTKVGGLGVNLTGANRIIIFDPDWNPSTDVQARERAWRIGQEKQVTIYRLLTSGTIEEKIYHRQIFKQFLTNRVLKDPRQRRFFKTNDLHELFTLGEDTEEGTETSAIFAGTGSEVKIGKKIKKPKKPESLDEKAKKLSENFTFSTEKQDRMKEIAKRLSQKIVSTINDDKNEIKDKNINETKDSPLLKVEMGESSLSSEPKKNETCDKKSEDKKLKKKKKKKRKSLDGIEFEGQKIDNLLKNEIFRNSIEDDDAHDMKQDEYLLNKLFKKSGVHSALKHDTIIDAADPDYLLVEGEAERVAREAVQALKRSRRQCEGATSGIPTWTGLHGSSGAPSAVKKRFGQKKNTKLDDLNKPSPSKSLSSSSPSKSSDTLSTSNAPSTSIFGKKKPDTQTYSKDKCTVMSSAELLAKIRERNPKQHARHRNDSSSSDSEAEALEKSSEVKQTNEYDELLCDIRNFLAFQSNVNGQGTTGEVLQAFKEKIPNQDAPVFKALLSKICHFVRAANGDGLWRLKPKFR